MDAIEALLTRRSIRAFTSDPIPDGVLRDLLQAAMYAPSAGDEQPWRFVVITERALLHRVQSFHPYAAMMDEAPLAVLVCGDLRLEKHKDMWVQDCSAATQNLLLAAHAHGLGAVWLGIHPIRERMDGCRRLLNLPEAVVPLALVPIGYPAEHPSQPRRFREERIHYNRF